MRVGDICQVLDSWAPRIYAEDFDNVGLIVGDPNWISNKILVTLDTTEEVVKEALGLDCKLIVSFHPVIFKDLKRLTRAQSSERLIMMALKHDIAIYVIHTNLDNHPQGTNHQIFQRLGLIDFKVLIPYKGALKKLITYVPKEHADQLREELFKAGAGSIRNYERCSYNINSLGTFMDNEQSSTVYGKKGGLHHQEEISINVVFPAHLESVLIEALLENHPYEEMPYEIFQLHNSHHNDIGLGGIGRLSKPMFEEIFLSFVKERMQTPCIRHSPLLNRPIERVAVLGGSGSFALSSAKNRGADAFVSADFKYHQFFKANNEILILDIGHYESEQFTKDLLVRVLREKLPKFAIIQSNTRTNPVHYFY
ncbi:Nif3-like dinuclear metal center hexameric protein [Bacteroidetes bacterium endosymbiont of Geopemphigus sp.]|uniref:Nif3-like dinuclear metal center hexameric protein n=1 Tax=Bacteroidetes bacterium endosymbiont of Geopemphigus sp. TaxID=2047937 RepID=UPI000CD3267D|nr:Nif3-like dinuclear metal center hexameric protein [Bacteroidetes bacterium endosymbiont of Geopemphigus sp.]